MAFPQGINFRLTAGYVTDGTNEDYELTGGGNNNYPRTTAQGNSVGWETVSVDYQPRNRNSANNRRLAGINFNATNGTWDYRVDLSASGSWNVRLAMGDPSYSSTVDCELFDTSSSLGVLCTGSTGAANSFKAADGNTYTHANWVSNEATHLVNKTFSTTICRFRVGTASTTNNNTAHLYVEAASGSTTYPMYAYAQQ